jgi:hypothetical protein
MSDDDQVARILEQIGDAADRAWLLDRISDPWQRRARRLEERDARIREYALTYHPLQSGRAMASAIAIELDRYCASVGALRPIWRSPGTHNAVSCGGYCISTTGRAHRRAPCEPLSPAFSLLARKNPAFWPPRPVDHGVSG